MEHAVLDFKGHPLLFVRIPEQQNKPVYLRGRDILKLISVQLVTCLLYEDKVSVTNQTMRERFGLDSKGTSMISHIIADTLESGLIKYENPEMSSKRYATYIPFYG